MTHKEISVACFLYCLTDHTDIEIKMLLEVYECGSGTSNSMPSIADDVQGFAKETELLTRHSALNSPHYNHVFVKCKLLGNGGGKVACANLCWVTSSCSVSSPKRLPETYKVKRLRLQS